MFRRARSQPRQAVAVLVLTGAVLGTAACGSQLDPATVLAASGGGTTTAAAGAATVPGAVAPDGSVTTGEAGGTAAGGAADATGSGAAGATAGGTAAGGSGGAAGGGSTSATGGTKAASCAGFANQTGITDDTITIANASDISGPVPGLFTSAQDAVQAYVAYFNATSDICGRKLKLLALDSKEDAGADQQAYATACAQAFAAVGSNSIFDSGGASTAENCKIPDIRSASLTDARNKCSVCLATQASKVNLIPAATLDYFLRTNKPATQHVAALYINAGGTPGIMKSYVAAVEKYGYKVDYVSGIDVTEFNYAPYVQQMKDKGIRYVSFLGADSQVVRMAQAMQQQNFTPDIFTAAQPQYGASFPKTGGTAVDGTYVSVSHRPFENAPAGSETALYLQWLQQVKPGAEPSSAGVFAWSAARLFVQEAIALGGKLTRATLLEKVRAEHAWTSNDLHAAADIGRQIPSKCFVNLRLSGSTWKALDGGKYLCGPLIDSGVTG